MAVGAGTPGAVPGRLLAPGSGQGSRPPSPSLEDAGATMPVEAPLLGPLHALQEAAGEEGHGHEQDDGAADDGGDHSHPEAEGLVGRHSCERDKTSSWHGPLRPSSGAHPALRSPCHREAGQLLLRGRSVPTLVGVRLSGKTARKKGWVEQGFGACVRVRGGTQRSSDGCQEALLVLTHCSLGSRPNPTEPQHGRVPSVGTI